MKKQTYNKAKIEDVAAAAGVSIMSVSRAMRDVEGISNAKRKQILSIARKLGYFPNRVAVSLAASSSNLIGVSVPTLFGTVFAEIFYSMRNSFDKSGFTTVIDITDYSPSREEEWVERMISWQPAGLILSGTDHSKRTRERLAKATIPVLEIWEHTDDPIDLCSGIDHYACGTMVGKYLVELGYKSPAYIGVERGRDVRADRRLTGLMQEFQMSGVTAILEDRNSRSSSFDEGFQATARLLNNAFSTPDVIYYLNDNMAFGGLMYCEQSGLKCPEHIGIVGCNGLNINTVLEKRITTVITPREEMGKQGAQMLIGKILGAKTKKTNALPVKLEKGHTTSQRA